MWVFSWLVLSVFQFITNMINVNMTSVCQVRLSSSYFSGWKYWWQTSYLHLVLSVSSKYHFPRHFSPFCSSPPLLFLFPPLLFLPWYLQCLSCSQSNGGLHQRCLYSPPTQLSLSLSVSACLSLPPTFSFFFFLNKTLSLLSPLSLFLLFQEFCHCFYVTVDVNWACVAAVLLDDPSGAAQNGWEVS